MFNVQLQAPWWCDPGLNILVRAISCLETERQAAAAAANSSRNTQAATESSTEEATFASLPQLSKPWRKYSDCP